VADIVQEQGFKLGLFYQLRLLNEKIDVFTSVGRHGGMAPGGKIPPRPINDRGQLERFFVVHH